LDLRLLFAVGGASIASFLPFYALLLRGWGLAPDEIGFVLAASSLAGVATASLWSHLADTRLGSVRTLQVASLASAVFALGLMLATSSLWTILVMASMLGIAQGPGTALGDAIALGRLGRRRMTEYGSIRSWASGGWAIAVLLFGVWFEHAGLDPVLPLYAAGTLAYVLVLTRFPARRPDHVSEHPSRLGSVGRAFRSSPRLLPFLLGVVLVSTATWGAWSFVPLRIQARGGGPFLVGLAAGVTAVIEIPFFRASSWLAGHVGLAVLYVAGCAVYVTMLVGLALAANPVAIAFIKMAGGAGFGLTYSALVVITGTLVPEHLRNTGQALMQIASSGVGPVVGVAVGGVVYRWLGATTLFLGAAGLTAIGAVVVWRSLAGAAVGRTAG
jgi:PPP family 3-phenylpropionic acid transporter